MRYQVFSAQGTLLANTFTYGDAMTCYDTNSLAVIVKEDSKVICQRATITNIIDIVLAKR